MSSDVPCIFLGCSHGNPDHYPSLLIHIISKIESTLHRNMPFRQSDSRLFQMCPRISIRGSICAQPCPSIGQSVHWSNTLSSKREINFFEQMNTKGGTLGSQLAKNFLYKTVYQSLRKSVYQSVSHVSANINENQQFSANESCNHVIIQSFHQHEDASLALCHVMGLVPVVNRI